MSGKRKESQAPNRIEAGEAKAQPNSHWEAKPLRLYSTLPHEADTMQLAAKRVAN